MLWYRVDLEETCSSIAERKREQLLWDANTWAIDLDAKLVWSLKWLL